MLDYRYRTHAAAVLLIVLSAITLLTLQGRVWWCSVGDALPWSFDIWSPHNSQHLIDPYSFTHVLHGILEFWLLGIVLWKAPIAWRFVLAILIESSWEVIENTDKVINRYREATISLDYYGDSIANSVSDIVFCGLGFAIAYKLKLKLSLVVFAVTEAILLLTIRDSLILNILMRLWPVDAIRVWQSGG
jgi:hypothetical protein